jgi:hypothetical protein
MKKLLFIPILFIAILSSNAQDIKKENGRRSMNKTLVQKTPEQRAEFMTKRMTEQLSLTKEQQERVYQLSLKQSKVHSEQAKKRQELAKLMKEENQRNRQEIKSVLTPEQQKKWDELKTQQMKSRRSKIDSNKRSFKTKPGMIKKPDSTRSRRPAAKTIPKQENN